MIGRDTEARANFLLAKVTEPRSVRGTRRRANWSPRAASPSNTVVLVMSLAVVAPHRAPSIDPALRAFLAECLDGTGVDGDVGDVQSSDVPDLPRALSFDDADVDLSGICAWLEGDVGLATNVDVDDDVVDARAKKRARPGSLDDDSVRPTPRTSGGDERGGRGRSPATPPRRDERSDEPGSVEYSDPTSDPGSDPGSVEYSDPGSDPKQARLRRNRASAALSRQRKRLELVHLRQRCRELERAVAHFQYVAQCASLENVNLRRRLENFENVDGVGRVASCVDIAAAAPVTRLPIPRMAPIRSTTTTTTMRRRTGHADGADHAEERSRGEDPGGDGGVSASGRHFAGEPFGANDAAYTLCDMPRVESRRRRGVASRSRRRGFGAGGLATGVWRRLTTTTQLATRGRRHEGTRRGDARRGRARRDRSRTRRAAPLSLWSPVDFNARRVGRPVPARLGRVERLNKHLNKPAVLAGPISAVLES